MYKENWTVMANMEMIKFQGEMVAALQVVLMVAVMVVEVIMVVAVFGV